MIMGKQNNAEKLRNELLKRITKHFKESDWIELGLAVGMVDEIQGDDRLLRSLSWGDQDYSGLAVKFGKQALDKLGLEPSSVVSPDLLSKLEGAFRVSCWLESENPALYKDIYQAQGAMEATATLEAVAKRLDINDVDTHTRRIRRGLVDDPQQAIGQAKELLETICKEILGLHGNDKATRIKDLPELMREVKKKLKLEVAGLPGEDQRVKLVAALTQITTAATEIRNIGLGTGHGVARGAQTDAILAELVVTSVSGVCHFLLATFEGQTELSDLEAQWFPEHSI